MRLDKWIAQYGGMSRSKATKVIRRKQVTIDGVMVNSPNTKITEGTVVELDGIRIEPLPKLLKDRSCKLVTYTGTYFENFSPELQTPYSLSKSMGWLYVKKLFSEFKLLKYLLTNPYGSLESKKFTASIINKWINEETVNLEFPYLIRDNMPAEFLIDDYVNNIENILDNNYPILEYSPSYIVETNLEFALRFSSKLKKYGYQCDLNISNNKVCNTVTGKNSVREKYIHSEDAFIEDYLKKAILNNKSN